MCNVEKNKQKEQVTQPPLPHKQNVTDAMVKCVIGVPRWSETPLTSIESGMIGNQKFPHSNLGFRLH